MIYLEARNESDAPIVAGGFYTKVQAIALLQSAIYRLRRETAPTFDASWGEQPMPIIGPSADETANLLASLQPSS